MSSDLFTWVSAIPWYAWIPIVAIVCGCITGIIKLRYQHKERIEMIRQGIHPDAGPGGKPLGDHREV
jgi:hypothetical protein